MAFGAACFGYLALFAVALGGLQQPGERLPPEMDRTVPSSGVGQESDAPNDAPDEAPDGAPADAPVDHRPPVGADSGVDTDSAAPPGAGEPREDAGR